MAYQPGGIGGNSNTTNYSFGGNQGAHQTSQGMFGYANVQLAAYVTHQQWPPIPVSLPSAHLMQRQVSHFPPQLNFNHPYSAPASASYPVQQVYYSPPYQSAPPPPGFSAYAPQHSQTHYWSQSAPVNYSVNSDPSGYKPSAPFRHELPQNQAAVRAQPAPMQRRPAVSKAPTLQKSAKSYPAATYSRQAVPQQSQASAQSPVKQESNERAVTPQKPQTPVKESTFKKAEPAKQITSEQAVAEKPKGRRSKSVPAEKADISGTEAAVTKSRPSKPEPYRGTGMKASKPVGRPKPPSIPLPPSPQVGEEQEKVTQQKPQKIVAEEHIYKVPDNRPRPEDHTYANVFPQAKPEENTYDKTWAKLNTTIEKQSEKTVDDSAEPIYDTIGPPAAEVENRSKSKSRSKSKVKAFFAGLKGKTKNVQSSKVSEAPSQKNDLQSLENAASLFSASNKEFSSAVDAHLKLLIEAGQAFNNKKPGMQSVLLGNAADTIPALKEQLRTMVSEGIAASLTYGDVLKNTAVEDMGPKWVDELMANINENQKRCQSVREYLVKYDEAFSARDRKRAMVKAGAPLLRTQNTLLKNRDG